VKERRGLPNYLFPLNFPNKTLFASSKLPLSPKSPHQNPVHVFQITSFPQISPTKPFLRLQNYLFHPNLPTKTLYTSSKLPLTLKFPHQNPFFLFQITSFPQISPPKPCTHLQNYLFPSNFPTKPLYRSSRLPLTFKFPHQNPFCVFKITSFTQISPPKPCTHLPNYPLPSNFPTKTLFSSSKLPLSLKFPQQNPFCVFQITSFPPFDLVDKNKTH